MATPEMRAVYAETLIELAEKNPDIVILEADLMKATGTGVFKEKFPERAINVGVAESNMLSVAGGLSAEGKIPFAATFGCFAARRALDQFFISCAYARLNVKLVGTDPGVSAAFNGGTHMPFEDLAIMRAVPQIDIVEPSDPVSLKALVKKLAERKNSAYLRLYRKALDPIYDASEQFEVGKAKVLKTGKDVCIVALGGLMVRESLRAHALLAEQGIDAAVIDALSLKPFDRETIVTAMSGKKLVVTVENHQINGALGSAVAEIIAEEGGPQLVRIGINDEFGEVGTEAYFLERFKLRGEDIAQRIREVYKK